MLKYIDNFHLKNTMRLFIVALWVLSIVGCGGGGGGDDNEKFHLNSDVMYYAPATTREEMFDSMCGGPVWQLPDDIQIGDQIGKSYDLVYNVLHDGTRNSAFWFHPDTPNGKYFFYHQGHRGDPRTYGMSTINGLLAEGYEVVAFQMPDVNAGHNKYNDVEYGLCVFVEPVIRMLNYLEDKNLANEVFMVGISGGGWTTSVVAAMDARIKGAYPVAGGMPGPNNGDFEQRAMVQVMDLLDQWRLARRVLAIQNYNDPCCSSGDAYLTFDAGPNFDAWVDYHNNKHSISKNSLALIIADAASL